MKIKFLPLLVSTLFATTLFFSSCLNSDMEEIELSSESSITSFKLGTVSIPRVGKDAAGKDSAYIDTLSCEHYPFTIDQLRRTIENKDSLPVGSDVSSVLAKIIADSPVIMYERKGKNGETKDTLWTAADSVDYTRPVIFKVFSQKGIMGNPYIVKVNVHKQVPDTLEWTHIPTPKFESGKLSHQKTIFLRDSLFTIGLNSNGDPVAEAIPVSQVSTGTWKKVANLPAGSNPYSCQRWNEALHFVADGKLYRFLQQGKLLKRIGELTDLRTIIAPGNIASGEEVLFVYNEDKKVVGVNAEGVPVRENPFDFVDGVAFASDRMSAMTFVTHHNTSITRTIVMSNNPGTTKNDSTSYVFGYTTNDTEWCKLTMTNPLICPNLENISMIYYDKKLYAFGGGLASLNIKPFESFYCSTDNGLTWKKVTEKVLFPQTDSEKHPQVRPFVNYYTPNVEGSYSVIVDDNHFIWFVWEDGSLTRGRINRLGFAPKW